MAHQTFWKPEKQVKEKSFSSFGQKKKGKKEVPEWKKDILSHHQDRPSRADRAEFSVKVIAELIQETEGKCQCGCGRMASSTHHVMPRGRSGRGVKTNALRTCEACHDNIQTDEEELQHWISLYEEMHGEHFWFDDQDWEAWNRKQATEMEVEQEKQHHLEQIDPIITLLTAATGRTLKAKELRLLEGLNQRDMAVFAKLMSDVVCAGITEVTTQPQTFGYGNFND
ncbi:MAG: HNH endonuclease [Gorillibacterium sp.]|nr:HNH endonuclease [Gorillibacterium sp.]